MKPVLIRTLIVTLVLAGLMGAPAGADGARQVSTATPTATPRYLRLSPAPPTRIPRTTATPITRQRARPTPTAAVPGVPLQPTPQPTGTPGALPETGEQPQPGGPLSEAYDENLLRNLGQLESYGYESTIIWDLDNGRAGQADVVTEVVNDPPAQRWELEVREAGGQPASYEVVRVEGQTYMNVGGEWREVMPSVEALVTRFAWVVDLQQYLDLSEGNFLGVETVDGIEAERYRYFSAAFDASRGPVELEGARADVWIDREREIPARVHMLLVGADPLGGSGAYTVDSTLMAVDEPIAIQAPVVAAPEELPATGETALILADVLKLPMFDTYRLTGSFRWDLETGEQGSADFYIEVDQRQPAERAELDVGEGLLRMSFEYVNIEGAAYIRRGNRWVSVEQFALPALAQQFGWIGDPRSFVVEGEGRLVGREMVSGLRTEHYVFERDALGSLPFLAEVEDARVDAWYSPEHDAYVRLNVQVEGLDARDVRGEYELESEVTDIDGPIAIERPAGFPEE